LIQTRVDRFLSSPQRVDVGMIGGEVGRGVEDGFDRVFYEKRISPR
jgi:hypothetical protein